MTRALTVTGLDFPHAVQAVRVLRHRTDLKSGKCSRQPVYAITDLTSQQASPQRLGQLARAQWTIENRLHLVRDTAFGEDASKMAATPHLTVGITLVRRGCHPTRSCAASGARKAATVSVSAPGLQRGATVQHRDR
ncbi:hypothetical protein [Streptomyces sp. NPDC126514]|uniref:hypothetical protein n=1 Tax=Streptomyces sp. NPDC126514 TaxID=3155210 RepID=UPI0033270D35